MGALIVYFLIGSVVAIPYLAFLLLRTRRELNALRDELRARGLIAPAGGGARAALGAAGDDARPLAAGVEAVPGDQRSRVGARDAAGEQSRTGRAT